MMERNSKYLAVSFTDRLNEDKLKNADQVIVTQKVYTKKEIRRWML